jgi:RNA polymerase sigma-70 factor (ECF subfamily)
MEEPMNPFDAGADSPMGNTLAVASDETTIFRTIHRITRSEEDAEDGLQESLLKAFIHLNKFDGRSKFSTWLTRIAINSALMIVRKKRAHPESPFDGDMLSGLLIVDPASDPERHLLERERNLKLRKAVRRLSPLLREATEIRYWEEVSVSEVAARTQASLLATKSRLLRARKSLVRALRET